MTLRFWNLVKLHGSKRDFNALFWNFVKSYSRKGYGINDMDNKMSLREKSAYVAGRIIKEDSEIKEKIIINLLDLSDEDCAKVNDFINELMK